MKDLIINHLEAKFKIAVVERDFWDKHRQRFRSQLLIIVGGENCMTFITGNTYMVRHEIKALGFSWDKNSKAWKRVMPLTPDEVEKMSGLEGIVVASGNGIDIDTRPARSYRQTYGRCEDAPCCGCCGPQFYGSNYDY